MSVEVYLTAKCGIQIKVISHIARAEPLFLT